MPGIGRIGEPDMTQLTSYAQPLARLFLGAIFLIAGLGKLPNVEGFTQYMASAGVPEILAWPVILLEILGGAALIAGFQARIAAVLLAGFSVLAALLYHNQLGDQLQQTMFLKNIAIAGGLLLVFAHGPGRYAVSKA
jgi:putative oxidoreductase